MTESVVAQTSEANGKRAGAELGTIITDGLSGTPDAVILFASPKYTFSELLKELDATCRPRVLVGCSSAGEFSGTTLREGSACAVALRSSEMAFSAGLGRGIRADRDGAAQEVINSFRGISTADYTFRSALILADALAGYTDNLVERLNLLTGGTYKLFGGGAGDDAQFSLTHVFFGTEAVTDAVVALEILSNKPLGIGVQHGWAPASEAMRVTQSDGMLVGGLNAASPVEVFEEYAQSTGQTFDTESPIPFFLHNTLGVETPTGHKIRVPLTVHDDGAVSCASDVPAGATVHIMETSSEAGMQAASNATEAALEQLGGLRPEVALFFDCVATRLRMGGEFGHELEALQQALGPTKFAGCNTYGQIARADGQFSGFHNCTAVVCIIPE